MSLYEVRVYDHSGNFQFIPKNITRIEFHQRISAPWNHQITMEYSIEDTWADKIRSIKDDWYIRIYRNDIYTGVKDKVYEGLHITTVDQTRSTGGLIFNLYGSGYTQLLTRRVVVPPEGSASVAKTGQAESVIKSFVSDCMVSPIDTDRIFPGVTIAADLSRGNYAEYDARYTNLLSVCENVADSGKVDFGISSTDVLGEVVFEVKPIWGKDLRFTNTEGNIPVVFDLEYNNMDIPILTTNASDEKNHIFVGGEGAKAQRDIIPVSSPTSTRSQWSRKEAFVEGRQQTAYGVNVVGQMELEKRKIIQRFTFDIIQREHSRWLINWNLGDLVTARYFNQLFDKKITEISVIVNGEFGADQNEVIAVEIEDVRI